MASEICIEQIQTGTLTPDCLNDWQVMRQVVINHLQSTFIEQAETIVQSLIREVQRLYNMWQVNRNEFANVVQGWYAT